MGGIQAGSWQQLLCCNSSNHLPGAFRIGNTAGTIENIISSRLYRAGSVGFVSKSGGLSNEMYNVLVCAWPKVDSFTFNISRELPTEFMKALLLEEMPFQVRLVLLVHPNLCRVVFCRSYIEV